MTRRTIIFDLETTGLSPRQGHRVIEVGAVALHGGEIVEEFHSLINAGYPIPWQAQQVHGISDAMLSDAPQPLEVFADFHNFIGSAPIVAHNAAFDISFLTAEFSRLGRVLSNPVYCTLKLGRKKLPTLPNHRLETIFYHLGGRIPAGNQRHRALDDARITAFVWRELNEIP
ncbi:MAG: 3'-5' exonuclease [Desulfuromonadaceae bacterium]|nr:3'-5' exonuclease [Desulfuromonadaceae bacterium]